jgi:hypothetical protein
MDEKSYIKLRNCIGGFWNRIHKFDKFFYINITTIDGLIDKNELYEDIKESMIMFDRYDVWNNLYTRDESLKKLKNTLLDETEKILSVKINTRLIKNMFLMEYLTKDINICKSNLLYSRMNDIIYEDKRLNASLNEKLLDDIFVNHKYSTVIENPTVHDYTLYFYTIDIYRCWAEIKKILFYLYVIYYQINFEPLDVETFEKNIRYFDEKGNYKILGECGKRIDNIAPLFRHLITDLITSQNIIAHNIKSLKSIFTIDEILSSDELTKKKFKKAVDDFKIAVEKFNKQSPVSNRENFKVLKDNIEKKINKLSLLFHLLDELKKKPLYSENFIDIINQYQNFLNNINNIPPVVGKHLIDEIGNLINIIQSKPTMDNTNTNNIINKKAYLRQMCDDDLHQYDIHDILRHFNDDEKKTPNTDTKIIVNQKKGGFTRICVGNNYHNYHTIINYTYKNGPNKYDIRFNFQDHFFKHFFELNSCNRPNMTRLIEHIVSAVKVKLHEQNIENTIRKYKYLIIFIKNIFNPSDTKIYRLNCKILNQNILDFYSIDISNDKNIPTDNILFTDTKAVKNYDYNYSGNKQIFCDSLKLKLDSQKSKETPAKRKTKNKINSPTAWTTGSSPQLLFPPDQASGERSRGKEPAE